MRHLLGGRAQRLAARADLEGCRLDLRNEVLEFLAHGVERAREGATPTAYTVMHMLAWELIPSLQGILVDELREDEGTA